MTLVDLFPQTFHMETIVELTVRKRRVDSAAITEPRV